MVDMSPQVFIICSVNGVAQSKRQLIIAGRASHGIQM